MGKKRKRPPCLKLKAAIIECGMSVDELRASPEVNIAPNTFSRKMNGWEEFKESEMIKISKKLNKSPLDIFFDYEVAN